MVSLGDFDASQKVWVGNLPNEAQSEDLDTHFRQIGEPLLCLVVRAGVGCIAYGTAEEAEDAIDAYQGSEIGGSVVETAPWGSKEKKGGGRPSATPLMGGRPQAGHGGAGGRGGYPVSNRGGPSGGKGQAPRPSGSGWAPASKAPAPSASKRYGGQGDSAWGNGGGGGGKGWNSGGGAAGGGGNWGGKGGNTWGNGGGGGGGGGAWGDSASSAHQGTAKSAWISIEPSSALVLQGLPQQAPAIVWEKGQTLFSYSAYLLSELVGANVAEDVEITHDTDWENFPEVAQACKRALGEENCFAVAHYAAAGVWGVGVASGWKGREASVRIALALAIVQGQQQKLPSLQKNYPEFVAQFRMLNGMTLPASSPWGDSWNGGGKSKDWKSGGGGGGGGGGEWNGNEWQNEEVPMMHMITLALDSPILDGGLTPEAPAVFHGGKCSKHFFSNAHSLLSEFIEDMSEVNFQDDMEGNILTEVCTAWTDAGGEETQACIARCPTMACWGAGMAYGKKNRESAAKLALAISLAQLSGRLEEIASNANYPEVAKVLQTAGLIEPPNKRRKAAGGGGMQMAADPLMAVPMMMNAAIAGELSGA